MKSLENLTTHLEAHHRSLIQLNQFLEIFWDVKEDRHLRKNPGEENKGETKKAKRPFVIPEKVPNFDTKTRIKIYIQVETFFKQLVYQSSIMTSVKKVQF